MKKKNAGDKTNIQFVKTCLILSKDNGKTLQVVSMVSALNNKTRKAKQKQLQKADTIYR